MWLYVCIFYFPFQFHVFGFTLLGDDHRSFRPSGQPQLCPLSHGPESHVLSPRSAVPSCCWHGECADDMFLKVPKGYLGAARQKHSERIGFGRMPSISIHLVIYSASILIVPACHLVRDYRRKQEGCGPVPHADCRQERQLLMEVFHRTPCRIWRKRAVGLTNRTTALGVET